MRSAAATMLIAASLLLQGCVAAVIPVVAAGAIGKTQIDAAKDRTREAEEELDREPQVQVEFPTGVMAEADPATGTSENYLPDPVEGDHPYLRLARYALDQVQRRSEALPVRSAILVDKVSLADPKMIDCGNRPFAVLIDLDPAMAEGGAARSAPEFAALLNQMREADITIAWVGDPRGATLIEQKQSADSPLINDSDVQLLVQRKGMRKQELRWNLSRTYCVLAIAGDTKADFDELFDYLRDPEYGIRLDMFIDKGWFLLPDPASLLASTNNPQEGEQAQ